MAWVWNRYFGKGGDASQGQFFPPAETGSTGSGAGESGGGGGTPNIPEEGKKWVGFDPTGLERAAKAAKELDQSTHSKEALNLAQMQEHTQQLKMQDSIKEHELAIRQYEVQKFKVQEEERRKTLEADNQYHQQRARYQDELARKRYDDQLAQQRRMQEENLRRQEESVEKQEAMRKGTIQYEAELRHKNEMIKLQAEMEGKAKVERENHDLTLEQIRVKSAEYRVTVLEGIKAAGSLIGEGITKFLNDWDKISATAAGLTLLAVGVYSAKMGTGIAGRFLEARLGKPSLIRETSKLTFLQSLRHPWKAAKRVITRPSNPLSGIVFEKKFEDRLQSLAKATINTKRNGGVYRNVLMYGPPGTGKTMFAKSLAHHSGMDYAILTGGDIVPLGKDGVTAMHKVFDWSHASRKGVVLFIDEADAFLRKRSKVSMTEDLRSTLNAFLYRTGETSRKFMMVLASNQPDQFDWAINDRLDELIPFALPEVDERFRMLKLYFRLYVMAPPRISWWKKPKPILLQEGTNWEQKLSVTAGKVDGFSGREISKLAVSWQGRAYGSVDGMLTEEVFDECVEEMVEQHRQKVTWEK